MNIRTDLALEAHEYAAADGRHLEGVRTHRRQYGPLWGDVVEILDERGQRLTGKPQPVPHGDKVVAEVIYRDGTIIDRIYNTL